MNMIVKGRHLEITPPIREYAEEKVGKAAKLLSGYIMEMEIELYTEKNPAIENSHVAEVTVFTKGPVIRAKEASTNLYAALDMVSEKLERQFRKYKGKLAKKHGPRAAEMLGMAEPFIEEASDEREASLVKEKVMEVKPMTTEEAILQLELLHHDFFVFASSESEEINVLYRRRDGDYGLIAPRLG